MLKNPEPSFDDSEVAPKDLKEQELLIIKDALLELEGSFGRLLEEKKESRVEKGSFAVSVFSNFINPMVVQCLDVLVEYLSNQTSTGFAVKGRGVTKLLDFLRGAFNEQVKTESGDLVQSLRHARQGQRGRQQAQGKRLSEEQE